MGKRRSGPGKEPRKWTYAEEQIGLPESTSHTWQSPRQPNFFAGASSYGSVAAPFLAGFAFTAIPILISLDDPPPVTEPAIFFFVISTVGFLYALQFSAWMNSFVAPPSVRLDWKREALVDENVYLRERKHHAADLRIAVAYLTRVSISFDVALLSFFLAIALLLVPEEWSGWRIAAIVPLGIAFLFELYSIFGQWTRRGLPEFWDPDHEAIVDSVDLEEPNATSRTAAGFDGERQPL